MKTRLGVLALGLAVLGASLLYADPVPGRKSGKVLILPNQRTLEGEIELLGERYRIRRKLGELWLPADKGVHLCSDWNDAFAFMASQANLLDPDERVRLAKWCQANALHDQALKQIQFALELRPRDAEALRLKMIIEQSARSSASRADAITPVSHAAPPSLDVGVTSLAMFAARVQPILTNTCLSCHQADRDTRFRLFRVTETSYRNALENNLVSALGQIDTENPELSPLLTKSVTNHGGGKTPLNGRDSVPFQTLQAWVRQVIETNPHLRTQRATVATVQPREIPRIATSPVPVESQLPKETQAKLESENIFAQKPPASAATTSTATQAPIAPQSSDTPRGLPALPASPLTENTAAPAPAVNSAFATANPLTPSASAPAVSGSDAYDAADFNKSMHPQR